ncbi:MAG: taurine dioxygenase, partial [Gammaproteobacteria bacterium]
MQVLPQSSVLGAELRDIDLSAELSDAQIAAINQALLDHQVIFFRDQQLSPQQYNDFARRFGQLQDYMFVDGLDGFPYITEIIKTENETESFGSFWHSDSAYLDIPPKITML